MIQPIAYKKTLEGKSGAHLITFDDGRDYVVKYHQPGFEKALVNEWIAYCLGRYLGLPIPFAQIVQIPQEFSTQVPALTQMSHTQFQFASLYVPDCFDGHQVTSVPQISNHQTMAGIILFDYWLCNRDRTRKNIVLCEDSPGAYRLWIIDHAEVFNSFNWVQTDLENLPTHLMKSATHELMLRFIDDEQYFFKYLDIIQTMPIHLIEEIVTVIPDGWNISQEEKKAMVTALIVRRKKILKKIIERYIKKVYRPIHKNKQ